MRAKTVFRSELDPVDLLRRAAAMYPDKVAVVHGERRITYRELGERAWRLANALTGAGLRRGERVAALLPNCPAMLEAHFAVPAAAGVLVCVNTRLSSGEIELILDHSDARFLLVDRELAPLVEPLDLAGVAVVRVDDSARTRPCSPPPPRSSPRAGSTTRRRRSRSTTRPGRPAARRASGTRTAGRTSAR
jgi:fatty-acyl-CoA synthase